HVGRFDHVVVNAHQDQIVDVHRSPSHARTSDGHGLAHTLPPLVPSITMTVSALSDRHDAESATPRQIDLRRGGRALAGSYLYEGDKLLTGWHSHDVHQIEYAMGGVVEVETRAGHYLLPPQQAAWLPVGLEHSATMNPDVKTIAVMFDPQLVPDAGDRARILAVSPLIREMMIYALRWPIDRPHGDEISDTFFRTLAHLVSEAL